MNRIAAVNAAELIPPFPFFPIRRCKPSEQCRVLECEVGSQKNEETI